MKLFLTLFFLVASWMSLKGQTAKNGSIGSADTLYMAGKYEAARMIYEANIKRQQSNIMPLTYFRLGYCYHKAGNYDAAMLNYNKALSLKPAPALRPNLYSRIARVYAIKKENQKALMWLDSAAYHGYLGLNEMDTLKDYNSIRKDKRFEAAYKVVYNRVYPCASNPKAREFDFWIGEWDVYQTGTSTPKIGHSLIQNVAGECLILENWTALGSVPNTGKSMNYYDATVGKWEQIWMGSGGGLAKFINGEYTNGAMRFVVDPLYIPAGADGKKPLGRFSFTNVAPGNVRQWQEQSVDDGKTWTTVYDYTYLRR